MEIIKRVFEPHNVYILEKKVVAKERYLMGSLSVRIVNNHLVKTPQRRMLALTIWTQYILAIIMAVNALSPYERAAVLGALP